MMESHLALNYLLKGRVKLLRGSDDRLILSYGKVLLLEYPPSDDVAI